MQDLDARLIRVGEFLGLQCQTLPLSPVAAENAEFLEKTIPRQPSCLVVNPRVFEQWIGGGNLPAQLVSLILSRFPYVLVHGLQPEAFDSVLVNALSHGRLHSVQAITGSGLAYEVAKEWRGICGPFSGLSFGPANPANDSVLTLTGSGPEVRRLISIGGQPLMAAVKLDRAEVLFTASKNVARLDAEVGDAPLSTYFSTLLPQAMALRYAAAEECWRPNAAFASVIIDDPLLRSRYGFLNFETLLHLARQHHFHSTIAFIPHNFKRSSVRVTRMFLDNPSHLSICFHGSDHTEAEFASDDPALLNALVQMAEERMALHQQMTGLSCDKVMVFPQGKFSMEAMRILKSRNFSAAVNTVPHPVEQSVRLTIGELAQPAVLRYGGFPLFIRKPIREIQSQDIAHNFFFGRPVLIVEHHDVFRRPESLGEIAAKVNAVAGDVHWSNLAAVVGNSLLTRRTADGTHHIRAYAGTLRLTNDSTSPRRYSVEWAGSCDRPLLEQILVDGTPDSSFAVVDSRPQLTVDLAPRSSRTLSLVHRQGQVTVRGLGPRRSAQAFLRRRLSEVRDNYLSKNQHVLTAARTLQRCFLR